MGLGPPAAARHTVAVVEDNWIEKVAVVHMAVAHIAVGCRLVGNRAVGRRAVAHTAVAGHIALVAIVVGWGYRQYRMTEVARQGTEMLDMEAAGMCQAWEVVEAIYHKVLAAEVRED